MPWKVSKRSGMRPYKIVKEATGQVVGSSATHSKAQASIRARYANSPDAPQKMKKGFPQ